MDHDREGTTLDPVRFPVERSKLAELARAFGDDDPVWHDDGAAHAAGLDAIPVPPTVTVLADHWRARGAVAMVDAVGGDLARILHGEVEWEFLHPVRVGDELTAVSHVERISTREGRRGGTMTVAEVVTTFTNAAGMLVTRRRDTLIETEER